MMVLLRSFRSERLRSWLDKLILATVIFFLSGPRESQAQQPMDYAVQANIIYRFTKYVDWPKNKKNIVSG